MKCTYLNGTFAVLTNIYTQDLLSAGQSDSAVDSESALGIRIPMWRYS